MGDSRVQQFVPLKKSNTVNRPKVPTDTFELINNSFYGVKWDGSGSACIRTGALTGVAASLSPGDALLPCQATMRRCILNDAGVEQYFLDKYNRLGHSPSITGTDDVGTASKVSDVGVFALAESEYKGKYVHNTTDGTYALITAKDSNDVLSIDADIMDINEEFEICTAGVGDGGDGQVMTRLSLFHYRFWVDGDGYPNWEMSPTPFRGSSIHPDFIVGTEIVPCVYYSSFEGSMYDASASAMVAPASIVTNMYAPGDKLCSLAGEYPKTNETRDEFRKMANQRGRGWSQMGFDSISALQLLYLIEYADFDSQSMIGRGRTHMTGGGWTAGSYIGKCDLSLSDGNGTNSVSTPTGYTTNYSTYRGIKEWFGNVWKFGDGININGHVPYVSNDPTDWQDDTADNYTPLDITLPVADNYIQTLQQQDRGFLPLAVGADTSKVTDYYWQSTGWRVVLLGGLAADAAYAGAFSLNAVSASSYDGVHIGGRLVFKPVTRNTKDYEHTVAMTNDTTFTGAIPMGYELEKIVFVNGSANIATLDLGTTSGANDVFKNQALAANAITTVVINKTFSMNTRQTLYLNDDDAGSSWNSSSITAILLMRRVLI